MKRASVSLDQSDSADGEAKGKLKYQTLLKEYLELQKEYVSRKKRLQVAKEKQELILAEARFLRRKRKYLLKSQAPNSDKVLLHLPRSNALQKVDQLLLPNSNPKGVEAKERDRSYEEDVRCTKKLKNLMIKDKVQWHYTAREFVEGNGTFRNRLCLD